MWSELRPDVIKIFGEDPGISNTPKDYLSHIDEVYKDDAYNSLSIEGYQVTEILIEKVKNNDWNPEVNLDDQDSRNALAARGYYEAFQSVKKSVANILSKEDSADIFARDLQHWYQQLFKPCMQAGILTPENIIGYRTNRVHIRGSRHVPPPKDAVTDAMHALFDCLKDEPYASVRAVLGHYLFVYIHPYMDGNGRLSRFLMNAMFAGGGHPWTIIKIEDRDRYMEALREIDENKNIAPFVELIKHS